MLVQKIHQLLENDNTTAPHAIYFAPQQGRGISCSVQLSKAPSIELSDPLL